MTTDTTYAGLTQLGQDSGLPASPDEATLERVPNPQAGFGYVARFTAPETENRAAGLVQPGGWAGRVRGERGCPGPAG